MKRRNYLALVGAKCAVLGGCLSERSGDNSVTILEYTSSVDDPSLSFSVEFTEDTISSESPAEISIISTNDGGDEISVLPPWYKGFSSPDSDYVLGLWHLNSPDLPSQGRATECFDEEWQGADGTYKFNGARPGTGERPIEHELEPDESETDEYRVVRDRFSDKCFPPGEYRFENEVYYWLDDSPPSPLTDAPSFQWFLEMEIN